MSEIDLKASGVNGYGHWYVYLAAEDGGEFVKVGTARDARHRVNSLRNGNPRSLTIVACVECCTVTRAWEVETAVLTSLGRARLGRRDWMRCSQDEAIAALKDAARQVLA